MRWLVVMVMVAGCIEPELVTCDDGRVCPKGTACDEAHHGCVSPDQLAACSGMPDLTACHATRVSDGVCFDGVCIVAGCGNGELEPGELCDDGNRIDGDGCSADCQSKEICGDGFLDKNHGEQCDDGNTLGRDGCSSVCTLESLEWRKIGDTPASRMAAAVAYDPIRRVMVAFGGQISFDPNTQPLGDTWEWDAGVWRSVGTKAAPSARWGAVMAFDYKRGRMVLFGGHDGTGYLNDTWEWDGATWTQLDTLLAPPGRTQAAMAWDPALHQIVLFGGTFYFGEYDDTWTFDGTAWTEAAPESSPPARYGAALVYDAAGQQLLLLGGKDQNDTWQFDGTTWTELDPPGTSIMTSCAAAYDPIAQHVVLSTHTAADTYETWTLVGTSWVGGAVAQHPPIPNAFSVVFDQDLGAIIEWNGSNALGPASPSVWRWDGASWTAMPAPVTPGVRTYMGLAHDPLRGRTVLFGGAGASDATTWEWDGRWWTQVATGGPPARGGMAMAFDGRQVVMFGGAVSATFLGDTWLWDGGSWTMSASAGPSPRAYPGVAYDSRRRRIVLFGGVDATTVFGDTWEWDGAAWNDITPTSSPPARYASALAYDADRGVAVLYGGNTGSNVAEDIWEWDGVTWSERHPAQSPGPRVNHSLHYDRARRRTVLLGGTLTPTLWEWDGVGWTQPSTPAGPPRSGRGVVYDETHRETVLYGGAFVLTGLGDTNTASWRGSDDEVCMSGRDVDRDGRIGCDDSDCAGLCQPLCLEPSDCDSSAPHCGDGTCSAIEDDRLCPADCPPSSSLCGDDYCAPDESAATCPLDCAI
jgi:cysteine-rich repeat protein